MRRIVIGFSTCVLFCALILPVAAEPNQSPSSSPTPAAASFVSDYIDHLVYMVVPDEKTKVPAGDEEMYRKAIAAANEYLSAKNIQVVSQEQVDKLRKDQAVLAEDVQGENISIAQLLAQKLNADVYIGIDAVVKSEKRGGQWFAQSNLTLTVYDPSTGQILGSKPYSQLDRSVGSADELARINAVQLGVRRIMGDVVRLAQANMRRAVADGIRYELKLLGTGDAKTVIAFVNKLKQAAQPSGAPAVTMIESHSLNDREGTWYVHFFGLPEDFGRLILKTAETIPGFEGLKLVAQRGKSFTFATGM
jgi:hypothetical protein